MLDGWFVYVCFVIGDLMLMLVDEMFEYGVLGLKVLKGMLVCLYLYVLDIDVVIVKVVVVGVIVMMLVVDMFWGDCYG